MSASPSQASQYEPAQFHPEFGYFAPTMRFRRKVMLALKGAVLGALAGGAVMFAMTMEREEENALAMLATPVTVAPTASTPTSSAPTSAAPASTTQTPAPTRPTPSRPAAVRNFAPVLFVPQSIALPAVVPVNPRGGGVEAPTVAATASGPLPSAASTVGVSPAASAVAAMASAPAAKAVAKAKKKIVREPHPERTARPYPPEPDPRAVYAGPPRRPFSLPIFGFGW